MNPELQQQLAELLKSLNGAASDAGAWAQSQLPPLVHEKVLYGRVWHAVLAAIVGVLAYRAYGFALAQYQRADGKKGNGYDLFVERPGGLVSVLAAGACIVCLIVTVLELRNLALAWVAPRLYIVEWLLDMVGK